MTTHERCATRRRQHLNLGPGELVAAVVFVLVLPRLVDGPDRRMPRLVQDLRGAGDPGPRDSRPATRREPPT